MTRFAIVGCGLIGQKRAAALPPEALVVACDLDETRARRVAGAHAEVTLDWRDAVAHPRVDAVIVATTHDLLPIVGTEAARRGKHVLLEKPGARRAHELDALAGLAAGDVIVRVGFNHRFHRAFLKMRSLVDDGAVGSPQFVRARYGHGGRIGYDGEWRAIPELSGGGQAIDQSMHLIDLARWFLGDFNRVEGATPTFFWNMPVEDNVFMLLRTRGGEIAQLHASWTEWKNLFSFELFGRDGKLEIGGLGGSYGVERLTWYRMLPEMGPPETTSWEYPMADDSWKVELDSFLGDVASGRLSGPGIVDAQRSLEIVERLYELNPR